MGYPAFNLSAEQLSSTDAIDAASLSTSARADLQRWLSMPEGLRQQVLRLMTEYVPPADGELDGPCVWQDASTGLCQHHEHRPQVCRDFDVGGQGCLDWRAAYADRL